MGPEDRKRLQFDERVMFNESRDREVNQPFEHDEGQIT